MESYSHGIKLKDYPARGRRRHLGSRPPASVQIGPAHPPTAFHRHSDETLLSPPGAGPHGADGGHVYARELHLRRSRERLALPVRAHVALYWAGSFCRHVEIFGTARGIAEHASPNPNARRAGREAPASASTSLRRHPAVFERLDGSGDQPQGRHGAFRLALFEGSVKNLGQPACLWRADRPG